MTQYQDIPPQPLRCMKIGLNSDFRDFYDHWFDTHPHEYVLMRNSRQGVSKREQFTLLEKVGFTVPLHGLVKDVWKKTSNSYLVVYEDEFAHCGEGKILYHTTLAAIEAADKYCSVFIPTTENPMQKAESRRLLAIGDRMWWLRYTSNNWMSNHATDVKVSVIGEALNRHNYALEGEHDFSFLNQFPLFAIDFVESMAHKQLMAIDFNSAPGIKGTGIEDFVQSVEVVKLISEFVWKSRLSHISLSGDNKS